MILWVLPHIYLDLKTFAVNELSLHLYKKLLQYVRASIPVFALMLQLALDVYAIRR